MVKDMNHSNYPPRGLLGIFLFLGLLATGCEGETRSHLNGVPKEPGQQQEPKQQPSAPDAAKESNPEKASAQPTKSKKAAFNREETLWLENLGERRRVLVEAKVCLREGQFGLECLLCRKHTKEHESILSTEVNAKDIHSALLAAGAKEGSPVQFTDKEGNPLKEPVLPSGTRIKVRLQYESEGKLVTVPAQQWVRDAKTKRDMKHEWVFAGSVLWPNPEEGKPRIYAANTDGAYICITDVPTAMLALPISSSNNPENREFQPHTERIPALDTKVTVILEPQPEDKKPGKRK